MPVVLAAQLAAKATIDFTLKKTKFIDRHKGQLNNRQSTAILRMLESPDGFEGGMTARKYVSITKTSKATATRDLQELVEIQALLSGGQGRTTHYFLNLPDLDA